MLELGLRVVYCALPRGRVGLEPLGRRVELVARRVHLGHRLAVAHAHPLDLEERVALQRRAHGGVSGGARGRGRVPVRGAHLERRLVSRPPLKVVALRAERRHLLGDERIDVRLDGGVVVLGVDVGQGVDVDRRRRQRERRRA
jgi:hypothetical protein